MSDDQVKLFESEQAKGAAASPVKKWYMVTNQLNLFYMMGTGLLMPPSGFGGKYYEDTLSCCPGWIPLFPNREARSAIEFSAKEKEYLIPCILEIDLSELRGPVKAVKSKGNAKDISFPEKVTGNESFVLVPAPLPITWVTSVFFETDNQKTACERDAGDFDNVDLSGVQLEVME